MKFLMNYERQPQIHADERRLMICVNLRLNSLYFLDLFGEHRYRFEQISDNAVVRDIEDGCLGIFVNRHDRPRVLHANQVLNRAGDSKRDVKLGRNCLTWRSDLAVNWEPLGVANGTRSSKISSQHLCQLLSQHEIVFALDTAPDRDNYLCLREINSLFRFLERRLGNHTHFANFNRYVLNRSTAAFCSLIGPVSSGLKRRKHGRLSIRYNVCIELAEKDSSCETNLPAVSFRADAIADERLAKTRRKLRSKVAHLVGVREENEVRIDLFDYLLHGVGVCVRSVVSEFWIRGADDFLHVVTGNLLRESRDIRTEDHRSRLLLQLRS